MSKFRKKFTTVEIFVEAELWWPNADVDGVLYKNVCITEDLNRERVVKCGAYISTPDGNIPLSPGDWIVTDETGTKWPMKHDAFVTNYESTKDATECKHVFVFQRQETRLTSYGHSRTYDVFFCSKCLEYVYVELKLTIDGRNYPGSGRRLSLKELPA